MDLRATSARVGQLRSPTRSPEERLLVYLFSQPHHRARPTRLGQESNPRKKFRLRSRASCDLLIALGVASNSLPQRSPPCKPSQAKPILLSLALSLSWAISENAYAQSGTCFSSNNANYDNKNKENIYKINKNDALTFNSISSENEAIYSTVLSGDLWNNYGNGGYFTMVQTV